MIRISPLTKRKLFGGVIYTDKLNQKKNNNDFMLAEMLNVSLCSKRGRLEKTIGVASDYLLIENNLNNMCDFKDNLCAKHRNIKQQNESYSGCCPKRCKFSEIGICTEKCLACKIFMCNYLIEKGYFFDVHGIAILRLRLTFLERLSIIGLLFTSLKTTTLYVKLVRLFEVVASVFFAGIIGILLCAM